MPKNVFVVIIVCAISILRPFLLNGAEDAKIALGEIFYDYGAVKEGESVSHTFTIKNTGFSDLIISRLHTGCPCLSTEISSRVIAAGEEAYLKVAYYSRGRPPGEDSGSVLIFSNDPSRSVAEIDIRVDVTGKETGLITGAGSAPDVPRISSEELYGLMQRGERVVLLDVREANEYSERHIEGAISIPKSGFDRKDKAVEDALEKIEKGVLAAVYCGAGHRSSYVTKVLRRRGWNAFNLDGITFWEKEYPVIRGPKLPPARVPCVLALEEAYEHYFKAFKDVVWIDVREGGDFSSGHIKGAVNIPLAVFESRIGEVPRGKEIVLYCEGRWKGGKCEASMSAGRILLEHGYKQGLVKVFEDGYNAWIDAGYPADAGLAVS